MTTPSDINPRDARIADLEAIVATQAAQIEALRVHVAELERRLGLDSQNSSSRL